MKLLFLWLFVVAEGHVYTHVENTPNMSILWLPLNALHVWQSWFTRSKAARMQKIWRRQRLTSTAFNTRMNDPILFKTCTKQAQHRTKPQWPALT